MGFENTDQPVSLVYCYIKIIWVVSLRTRETEIIVSALQISIDNVKQNKVLILNKQ
jgi:hypothetical protein